MARFPNSLLQIIWAYLSGLPKARDSNIHQAGGQIMRANFTKLICGEPNGNSQLAKSLQHLSVTLDSILAEFPAPYGSNTSVSPLYAPFLARSLLEVSFTSLVARADPFRILTIGGAQAHSTYDPNVSTSLAFRWQGDVLADDKADLWNTKTKADDVPRALLGNYQERLLWRPAFERFLDHSNQTVTSRQWTSDLEMIGIDVFIPKYRGLAKALFSRASKGVHHEYVIPPSTYFDQSSLQDLLDETLKVVASLAVVANFCEHFSFRIPETDAFTLFESLQP